jgi:hypothetical protein
MTSATLASEMPTFADEARSSLEDGLVSPPW